MVDMYYMIMLIAVMCLTVLVGTVEDAHGHVPHVYSQTALPVGTGAMNFTMHVDLSGPNYPTNPYSENLRITLADATTGKALNDVVYRVSVLKEELLARGLFYDSYGQLDISIILDTDCDEQEPEKCSVYRGKEHASWPGALYSPYGPCDYDDPHSCTRPTITGPAFAEGGLYKIIIDVLHVDDPRWQESNGGNPVTYEILVTRPNVYSFQIEADGGKEDRVSVESHYDVISSLTVDQADASITFDMPFDWSHDHVEQVFAVYEKVSVPTSLAQRNVTNLRLFVDGIDMSQRVMGTLSHSGEHNNILIVMTQTDLSRINDMLGENHSAHDSMNFRLVPAGGAAKDVAYLRLAGPEAYHAQAPVTARISWDGERAANQATGFEFAFLDERGRQVEDVLYAYAVCAEQGGHAGTAGFDWNDPACLWVGSSKEAHVHELGIPNEGGRFQVYVEVFGFGQDRANGGTGSAMIEVSPQGPGTAEPERGIITLATIKIHALLWTEGVVHDYHFAHGVTGILVTYGFVQISPAAFDDGLNIGPLPGWLKTFVGYWVDGTINDATFLNSMQFLIEEGIL